MLLVLLLFVDGACGCDEAVRMVALPAAVIMMLLGLSSVVMIKKMVIRRRGRRATNN